MQVMVLLVLGIVGASVWAVVIDTLYPAFINTSGFQKLLVFMIALIFLLLVSCSCHFFTIDYQEVPLYILDS